MRKLVLFVIALALTLTASVAFAGTEVGNAGPQQGYETGNG